MSDEIRRLSDELARDPSSLVFVPLGEALRRQGATDLALKVALRGLERHPYHADGHDLVARIAVDRGEMERALDEWDMALRLDPQHVGARKGLGFVCFQQGRFAEAEEHLAAAALLDADDPSIASALRRVRAVVSTSATAPTTAPAESEVAPAAPAVEEAAPVGDPRLAFGDLLTGTAAAALLLDGSGLVLAGAYFVEDGQDVGQEVGAALSGVRDEVERATRHLGVGKWESITFETAHATVSMAPAASDALLLLATSPTTPLGLTRRLLARSVQRAAEFLGGIA